VSSGKGARKILLGIIVASGLVAAPCAFAQGGFSGRGARQWVIESEGRAAMLPDTIHLMMKMEYEAAQATDATKRGEKQLADFLAAVDAMKIANLSHQVFNNVITPGPSVTSEFAGFVYTRNVVFTLHRPAPSENSGELDRTIAQIEDLGARYNSHCVTCIGTG